MSIISHKDIIGDDGSLDALKAKLEELKKAVLEFGGVLSKQGALINPGDTEAVNKYSKSVAQLTQMEKEQLAVEKLIEEQNKREIKLKAELSQSGEKLSKTIAQLRVEKQQKNKIETEEAKLLSALSTEYEKQSIKLNRLRKRYKDLVLAEKENTKEARLLKKEIDRLDTSLKKADASVGQFQRNVGNYSSALKNARSAFISLAQAAGVTFGAFGAVRLIQDATRIIADFETKLVAVGKTTNIQGEALDDLGKRFRDLATGSLRGIELDSLLELAETAGQLGISGVDNITKFTETLARLEKGTDVVGQDGAQAIARILNVTNESVDTVDRFASSIVALGNNFAATESEIIDNTIEIARGIAIYKVASFEAAALGTVTRALGIQSEVAGSALQRTFDIINTAVASGGQKFLELQRITGSSAEQLREDYGKSSVDVFRQFIEGLNRIDESGGNVSTTLQAMGINGIRYGKVLKPLVGRVDELNRALELSEISNRQNTANLIESERALNTLNSELIGLQSAWKDYVLGLDEATDAGLRVRGAVRFIADNIDALIDTLAVAITAFGAWRGAVFLSTNAGRIWAGITSGMSAAANFFRGNIQAATVSLRTFKAALATTGFGLFIIAISELIFNFDKLRDAINGVTPSLRKATQEINTLADSKIGLIQKLLELEEGTDEYKQALLDLQQAYPDVLDSMDKEKSKQEALLLAIQDVNEARIAGITLARTKSKISDIDEKIAGIEDDVNSVVAEFINKLALSNNASSKKIAVELAKPENIRGAVEAFRKYDKGDPFFPDYSGLAEAVANATSLDVRPLGDEGIKILRAIEAESGNLVVLENLRSKALDELNKVTEVFEEASKLQPKDQGDRIQQTIKDLEGNVQELISQRDGLETDPTSALYDREAFRRINAEIRKQQAIIADLKEQGGKGAKGTSPEDLAREARKLRRQELIDEQELIAKRNKLILDDEKATFEQRTSAAEAIAEAEGRISQITEQDKLDEKKLSAERIKLIANETAFELEQIERGLADNLEKIDEDRIKAREAADKLFLQELIADYDLAIDNADRDIKSLEDRLKTAKGAEKTAITNALIEELDALKKLEIARAKYKADIDAIGLKEGSVELKIVSTNLAADIANIEEKFKGLIDNLLPTDPLERFAFVAEQIFQGLFDRLGQLQQRQLDLVQQSIQQSNAAIAAQEARAAQGQRNTLAFEKKRLLEREKLYLQQQRKLDRIEKTRAFFSLLRANADSENPIVDTITQFSLAEIFAAGFKEGGYTGDVGVNKVAGVTHGREFVIDAPMTSQLGLKGATMSDFKNRFMPTSKGGIIDVNHFSKERKALVKEVPKLSDAGIRSDLNRLIGIIDSKPETTIDIDGMINGMVQITETKKLKGRTVVNKHRRRI